MPRKDSEYKWEKPDSFSGVCSSYPRFLRWFLGPFEWCGDWVMYTYDRSSSFRLLVIFLASVPIIATFLTVSYDLSKRHEDRVFRAWRILIDARKGGNFGQLEALEFLNREKRSLRRLNLSEADLSNANLPNANIEWTNLRGSILKNGFFKSANLMHAELHNSNFEEAVLSNANMSYAGASNIRLTGADLRGANLNRSYLGGADFRSAKLNNVSMFGSYIAGADFRGAEGLTQKIINEACIGLNQDNPPILDAPLKTPKPGKCKELNTKP